LTTLTNVHRIHAAVVGFVDDPELAADESIPTFVTRGMMSALTSTFHLPFDERSAIAMHKIIDGVWSLR